METIQQAVEYVQSGKLGKIEFAKGLCYKPRQSIGQGGGGEIPAGLDYDLWCGPAQIEDPLRRKRFHYDWHWFYEYGNGDMGNQGIHQMDVARWFLGEKKLSPMVLSIGDRLGYADDGTTPNTQLVYHAYESAPLIFETRGLPSNKAAQTDGWGKKMDKPEEFPDQGGISVVDPVRKRTRLLQLRRQGENHRQRRCRSAQGRKAAPAPTCTFKTSSRPCAAASTRISLPTAKRPHISSALCHTGLISHQVGTPLHDSENSREDRQRQVPHRTLRGDGAASRAQ